MPPCSVLLVPLVLSVDVVLGGAGSVVDAVVHELDDADWVVDAVVGELDDVPALQNGDGQMPDAVCSAHHAASASHQPRPLQSPIGTQAAEAVDVDKDVVDESPGAEVDAASVVDGSVVATSTSVVVATAVEELMADPTASTRMSAQFRNSSAIALLASGSGACAPLRSGEKASMSGHWLSEHAQPQKSNLLQPRLSKRRR